ncbi:hypothetical protein BVRB_7g158550 [Beta vulgaris subsp. vulgaris]|nr:hypothetical protein BVRB_7g158550 [Beta vulgaris subsp. vulgaris]
MAMLSYVHNIVLFHLLMLVCGGGIVIASSFCILTCHPRYIQQSL